MAEHDAIVMDEARKIYEQLPDASKREHGEALFDRLDGVGDPVFVHWLTEAQIAACARMVTNAKREAMPLLSHDGRPLTSAAQLSVKVYDEIGSYARQLSMFRTVSPAAFIEAVKREQNVIDGRAAANRQRLEIVGLFELRPELLSYPTVEAAILAAGLDPNDYFLDEEAAS